MKVREADFVVVGSGLAGSTAAYALCGLGDVALLSREPAQGSNSFAAQGGVAAAMSAEDSPLRHAADTLQAGSGLCDPDAVSLLVSRAPQLMRWLMDSGVSFDRDEAGNLALGLEGAHGVNRILHAGGDATGRHILETVRRLLAGRSNVLQVDNVQVVKLLKDHGGRVAGALAVESGESAVRVAWLARRAVILATGGSGQLFSRTTNPPGALGDGVALAYEAGAQVRNLEFIQFHPTALAVAGSPPFLVSEAVRGAGARLIDAAGRPVMTNGAGDLAPRDVVARAIYRHQSLTGDVYLDTTLISDFSARFPTIHEYCRARGIDPQTTPLPVSPAAHFMMGGIAASLSGQTNVPGLYALGEAACTGVHGANRLASNSLLECLVTAFELAHAMKEDSLTGRRGHREGSAQFAAGRELSSASSDVLQRVQTILWRSAGIERCADSLQEGLHALRELKQHDPQSSAVVTASLIVKSALARRESRGAHYRTDYPVADPQFANDTLLCKEQAVCLGNM